MSENISPQTICRVQREVRQLVKAPPEGVSYVPNKDDSIATVVCDLDGPVGTPYEQGTFRVKLVLGNEYPSSPPKGFFLTTIFHPNVATNGDICVNTLKKDWSAATTLVHVFQVIRCLLIVPFPESSLNEEAGKMFMEDYDGYRRRAKIMCSVHAHKRRGLEDASAAAANVCGAAAMADDDDDEDGEGLEGAEGAARSGVVTMAGSGSGAAGGAGSGGGGKAAAKKPAAKVKDAKKKKALRRL